jgi:hypothetical protein
MVNQEGLPNCLIGLERGFCGQPIEAGRQPARMHAKRDGTAAAALAKNALAFSRAPGSRKWHP